MGKGNKPRIGRPPRQDAPQKMIVVLPGALRRQLKARSVREARAMSDIVADALTLHFSRERADE
jgi:hypothetical protein